MDCADLKEAFGVFDLNGDGFITAEELKKVLKSLGKEVSLEEAKQMIGNADHNKDGQISMEEFVKLMGNSLKKPLTENELKQVFAAFDKDKKGYIDRQDLKSTMNQLGMEITEEEVQQMLKTIKSKSKNKITYKEFETFANNFKRTLVNKSQAVSSDQELNDLKVTFRAFDKDNDGKVTVKEVQATLNSLGMNVSLEQAEDMVRMVDLDGNGTISFGEFQQLMNNYYDSNQSIELIEVFRIFDKDNDGFLDARDLKNTMRQLGMQVSKDDINHMMLIAGANGGNKISYQDFKRIFNCREGRLSRFSSMASINSNIRNQDKEGLQAVFSLFDSDGDGFITMDEVMRVLGQMNIHSSSEYVDQIFKQVDLDGNGKIDLDEFMLLTSRHDSPLSDDQEVKEMFAHIDKDNSGSIETHELKEAFIALGVKINDADVTAMLKLADIKGNTIYYEDFQRIMRSIHLSSNASTQKHPSLTSSASENLLTVPTHHSNYSIHKDSRTSSSNQNQKTSSKHKNASLKPQTSLPSSSSNASEHNRRSSSTTWEAFKLFDENCDGYISKEELFNTMNKLGIPLTLVDLEAMMKQADVNKDGRIDYSEFSKLMCGTFEQYAEKAAQMRRTFLLSPSKSQPGEEEMRASFKVFDINSDGLIDASELRQTLDNLNYNITQQQLDNIMSVADVNKDNKIDYEEFLSVLKNHSQFFGH